MKLELDNMHSLMDLARYMVKQENQIRDLKQENYELSREKLRLEQQIHEIENLKFTLVNRERKEVTE